MAMRHRRVTCPVGPARSDAKALETSWGLSRRVAGVERCGRAERRLHTQGCAVQVPELPLIPWVSGMELEPGSNSNPEMVQDEDYWDHLPEEQQAVIFALVLEPQWCALWNTGRVAATGGVRAACRSWRRRHDAMLWVIQVQSSTLYPAVALVEGTADMLWVRVHILQPRSLSPLASFVKRRAAPVSSVALRWTAKGTNNGSDLQISFASRSVKADAQPGRVFSARRWETPQLMLQVASISTLAQLPHLTSLKVEDWPTDSTVVRALAGLPTLTSLSLRCGYVGGHERLLMSGLAMRALAAAPALRALHLEGAEFSAQAMSRLHSLTQ